jgi:peptide deformylase
VTLLPDLPPGQVLEVVRAPAVGLSMRCVDVDAADGAVVALAADLIATQRAARGCVGLAANQVGVAWRVFCVDVSEHPKARTVHGPFVLVNPRLVQASRHEKGREGCLSVPDLTGDVKRATRVVVEGLAPGTGELLTVATDAFEARALQHELDHVDGVLFLDRVAGAHAIYPRQTYL